MKTKLLLMLLVAAALSVPTMAGSIKVVNPGFEYDILADGDYQVDVAAWFDGYYDLAAQGDPWYYGNSWASGVYNPIAGDFNTGQAPEGQNIAWAANYASYDMGLAQVLEHRFIKTARYTLAVKVGNPLYNEDDGTGDTVGSYRIEVLDNRGRVLDSETGPPPAPGEWIDVHIGPFHRDGGNWAFDLPMEIRLLQLDFTGNDDGEHYLHFDAITLEHNKPSMTIETPDMITWDGQGVDLAATAWGGVISQTWTSDPADGVVFSGGSTSPPENALDPTVTVIIPGGGLITSAHIVNADFEDDVLGDGACQSFPFWGDGWLIVSPLNWWAGAWNVTVNDFPFDEAYEGDNVGYVEVYKADGIYGMRQVLGDRLMANVEYTLTVQVGNTGRNTGWPGYRVELLAGGVIVAEDVNTNTVEPNTWVMSTVVYDSGVTPPQDGELLEIRLETLGLYTAPGELDVSEVCYDDVQLTSDNPVFQRPSWYPVKVIVTGNDGSADAQPVSVELNVYRDPCRATLAAGLQEDTDLDGDCIAGLPDLAEVLETWQDHNALTEPRAVERPAPPETGAPIAIVNAGFEDPPQSDGNHQDFTETSPVPPPTYGWFGIGGAWAGVANPAESTGSYVGFGGITPEGENLGTAGGGDALDRLEPGLAQVLTETFESGMNYTLTVEIGNNPWFNWNGYKVQLLAGGTVLAEDDSSLTPADDIFELSTVAYEYTPADAGLVGQDLEIRLIALGFPSADTYLEINFDDVQLTAISNMDPSPEDGEYIHPVDPLTLSWTNLPANVGNDVWVDVWFGTDPDPKNGTQIVTAGVDGLNKTSVDVNASVLNTYYWQVDSYLEGVSTGTPLAGAIWSVHVVTDIPVKVDAGDSWVTWSGQAVQKAPITDDAGESTVTYAWFADPNDGVAFSPAGADPWRSTDETPEITMTGTTGNPTRITVTLTATDDAGSDTDYLTVEVYDTACAAAIGEDGVKLDQGDLDEDCDTDLADIAVMSVMWDYDYAMIAPVPKPI